MIKKKCSDAPGIPYTPVYKTHFFPPIFVSKSGCVLNMLLEFFNFRFSKYLNIERWQYNRLYESAFTCSDKLLVVLFLRVVLNYNICLLLPYSIHL